MLARRLLLVISALFARGLIGCGGSSESGAGGDLPLDSSTRDTAPVADADATIPCSAATCVGAGKSCRSGACVEDCRPTGATACAGGTACDFTDGKCRDAKSPCFLTGPFEACGSKQCGPGTVCGGDGACATATTACAGVDCDESGRCWGSSCDRPTATCVPAPLDRLNQGDFVGSLVNMRDEEGAFDLDFDEICNAYTVTMISGPDYLRQLTPDGKFTEWTSTTNLNMGQVAVLRALAGEFKVIGDIAGASPSRPTAGSTTCRCIRRRTGRAPRIRSCAGSCRSGDDATARATAQMAKIQGRRVTSANRVIIAA